MVFIFFNIGEEEEVERVIKYGVIFFGGGEVRGSIVINFFFDEGIIFKDIIFMMDAVDIFFKFGA